jgi:hypothetical protein
MAAFVKSVEEVRTTAFTTASGLETVEIDLTKGQDETKCVPWGVTIQSAADTGRDFRKDNCVSVELYDNAGTPAVRLRRQGNATAGADVDVTLYVVEFGANVTVQQGTVTLNTTAQTDTISSVTQANAFVVFTQHSAQAASSSAPNRAVIQASFQSATLVEFERRGAGSTHYVVYYYVVESNGTDFLTEYIEADFTTSDADKSHTLTNTVTLANAFLVCSYEIAEGQDDLRDFSVQFELSGTTSMHLRRGAAGATPNSAGTTGVWVVRTDSSGANVQRFTPDIADAVTTDQAITAVDLSKAVVNPCQNTGMQGWSREDSINGDDIDQRQHEMWLTSTTNLRLKRRADTDATNTKTIYVEVIEFELETAAADFSPMIAATRRRRLPHTRM